MGNQSSSDNNRKYGWRRDNPDQRDKTKYFSIVNHKSFNNDLRNKCPPVYNQLNLGSCTANALAFAYQFDEKTEDFTPSRLFIYYNERKLENTIDSDSGASLRDGIKTINKIGVCNEDNWVYDPNNFSDKPPENCYKEAKLHRTVKYHKIKQELNQFKGCIKSGYPFVFGFSVYQSFESDEVASNGLMPIPAKDEKLLGGHAVAAVGFDDSKKCMIIRNSWGEEWGDNGYFYMPYKFIINPAFCSDFWVIEKVEESNDNQQQNQDNNNSSNVQTENQENIESRNNEPEILTDNENNNDNDADEEFELEKDDFDSNNNDVNYVI